MAPGDRGRAPVDAADRLRRAGDAVAPAPSLDDVLSRALNEVCTVIGWAAGHAYTVDDAGSVAPAPVWWLRDPERFAPFRAVSDGADLVPTAVLRAAESGEPVWVEAAASDSSFLRSRALTLTGLTVGVCLPVVSHDEVIAVVELLNDDPAILGDASRRTQTVGAITALGDALARHRLEQAARDLEERFEVVFDGPLGMAIIDTELIVTEANAALAALLGIARQQLAGRPLDSLVVADDAAAVRGLVLEFLASDHGSASGRARFVTAADGEMPVSLRVWRHQQDGHTSSPLIVLLDPETEHRRIAQKARDSTERRRIALHRISVHDDEPGLIQAIADAAQDLVLADSAALGLTGSHGQPFTTLVTAGGPPDLGARIRGLPAARGVLGALVLENRPLRISDVADHPAFAGFPEGASDMRAFLGVPLIARGHVMGHLIVARGPESATFDGADEMLLTDFAISAATAIARVRSISEARRAGATLQRLTAANLELLRRVRPDRLLQAAADLARTVASAEFGALWVAGQGDGELPTFVHSGLAPSAAAAIGAHPQAIGLLRAAMIGGRPMRLSRLDEHPASSGFPPHHPTMTSFLSVPLRRGGEVRGLLFVTNKRDGEGFREVDEDALVELASGVSTTWEEAGEMPETADLLVRLAAASERLREETVSRWNFLGTLSHDLRGAISGILMSTELLADPQFGPLSDDQVRDMATRMRSVARSLLALVDNLLDLSRIESRRLEVQMQSVNIGTVLAGVRDEIQPEAFERGVILDIPPVEDLPRALADPVRMRQVLVNLLSNAVKFTPRTGHVWVECSATEHDVTLAVCDTGSGIETDDLQRIFEPFERVKESGAPGTGLGLAIAKAIMERHGGRLEVTSWPEMGSRFSATFRVAREPLLRGLEGTRGGDVSPTLGSRTGSALVVEDDETNREGVVTVLRSAGYTVRAVPDRASALTAMADEPADLVLLDAQLPDGDGMEIVGALREAAGERRVVVVALSADRIGRTEERAARARCDAFLLKPVEPRELLRRLAELIDAG